MQQTQIHQYEEQAMNKLNISAIAAAIALAFSAGAMAMSKADYTSGQAGIAADFKSAKAGCDSFSANAKNICMAEAKGKQNIALAELESGYKPTYKTRYNAGIARAESNYSVAMARCDDKAGNDKD